MADCVVTHARRNDDGNIVAIGNPDTDWYQRDARWAIQDILENRHRYLVISSTGTPRPIDVVDGPSGAYLRSRGDSIDTNNLDFMPDFDMNPWEIPLDNTEIFAIHAALVPHGPEGQVLMMGGDEHDRSMAMENDVFNTRIYDVLGNTMIDLGEDENPDADVFCCGHAFLADGRLLVGGGTEFWNERPQDIDDDDVIDIPDPDPHVDMHQQPRDHWSGAIECSIYNNDGTWTTAASLLPQPDQEADRGGGRWYPTLLTLPDGRVLAVGGHPRLSDQRHGAWLPEVYDVATDSWTYQPGHWIYVTWGDIAVEREMNDDDSPGDPILDDEGNLQELVELPEGQTRPTEGDADNPIQNADRNWNYLYYPRLFVVPEGRVFMASPNDGNCRWYDIDTGIPTGPMIEWPAHGGTFAETNHTAVLLPLLPAAEPERRYEAHVLFMGNSGPRRISIGTSDATDPPLWLETPPRDWPDVVPDNWPQSPPKRRHGIATLLPTGQVLFTGGINENAASGLPDTAAVLAAEMYTPGIDWESGLVTFEGENWTTTPEAAIPRNYHSTALLLPNGRVLTAGSNIDGRGGSDDRKTFEIETYTPEWFHDARRPEITEAPPAVSYGETFGIECTRSNQIERAALMRCGSVTHAWDGDQRYVGVEFTSNDDGLTITAPPNGAVAPPGPYMLWIIMADGPDSAGLPCKLAPFVILS